MWQDVGINIGKFVHVSISYTDPSHDSQKEIDRTYVIDDWDF